jgi:dihydropteroate synthase
MSRCLVTGIPIGRGYPVRLMGVINCSPESFYKGSYVCSGTILCRAADMVAAGADIIDLGARSTAPGSPPISEQVEAERMELALGELDGSGIPVSVDTMHASVLERCCSHDIHAANDISGFRDPAYARLVADAGLPAFLMASDRQPGDSVTLAGTFAALDRVISRCADAGIDNYVLDPAIGLWSPERTTALDWELCRHFAEFARFGRPLLAAVSRKTFLGEPGNRPAEERLASSLAMTALLIGKGADVVRTHDVRETVQVIRTASWVVGRP